jgi:hypothetical protein
MQERCLLIVDEINYLQRLIEYAEDIFNKYHQNRHSKWAIYAATIGIISSTILSLTSSNAETQVIVNNPSRSPEISSEAHQILTDISNRLNRLEQNLPETSKVQIELSPALHESLEHSA